MPQLSEGFEIFVNWQTILFCLGVYIITYIARTVVEALWKRSREKNLWTELFLPLGPIGTGMILAVVAHFPWPMPIGESVTAKVMYGGVCGMASGWIYSRLRAWLKISVDKGSPTAAKILKLTSVRPPAPKADSLPPGPDEDDSSSEAEVQSESDKNEG